MFRHQIFLSSSYSLKTRIGIHLVDCDDSAIDDIVKSIRGAYDGKKVSFSTHVIHTDSDTWESVVDRDPYFDDVMVIESVDEFVGIIQKDRYLKGIDIAKYILSLSSCTHTRIEKLTYMCYADYLCETGSKLFDDEIYAFSYGPIVKTVYEKYRDRSKEKPGKPLESYEEPIPQNDIRMALRSRINFSEDGEKKMASIDRTLKKFEKIGTEDIVALTHSKGSPWDVSEKGLYKTISDDAIIEHHHVEEPA